MIDHKKSTLLATLSVGCVLTLFIAVWASGLWVASDRWGIGDWGCNTARLEAIRATVVEFGQWPGNNPWISGGLPLLGNPTLSLFSIPGVLSLFVGAHWGNQLAILLLIYIGWAGSWLLSGLWWKETWLRAVFSFYIIANPALIHHLTGGHLAFPNFYFLPAAFYFFLRWSDDPWSGLKAGAILGLAFLHSLAYMVQYAFAVFFPILLCHYILTPRGNWRPLLRWCTLFSLSFGTLCAYRIMTVLPVATAFPRMLEFKYHLSFAEVISVFFKPVVVQGMMVNPARLPYCYSTTELCAYLGLAATGLFVISSVLRFRWWHLAAMILAWASIGNDRAYHIMYWLQKLPLFSSHLCYARIRVFVFLFFGLAITDALYLLWLRCKTLPFKIAVVSLGTLAAGEVLYVSHQIMRGSHTSTAVDVRPDYSSEFQNWGGYPFPPPKGLKALEFEGVLTYLGTLQNKGYLRGLGDSYVPGTSLARGRDEVGYIAEFHQDGRAVAPKYWSPNRILLEELDPEKPLNVNMNPGSAWHLNGSPAFPDQKIVELQKPFIVMPDKNGVVELTYHSPGHVVGLIGTIVLGIALAVSIHFFRRARPLTEPRCA